MVLHCQWGTCTGDIRYPEKILGGKIYYFPSVKTRKEDAMAWIKACSRPHQQLNSKNLNRNKAKGVSVSFSIIVCAGVSVCYLFVKNY